MMSGNKEELQKYETLIKLLRRHLVSHAFVGEEVDVLQDVCEGCYEVVLESRELIKEIDKVLNINAAKYGREEKR